MSMKMSNYPIRVLYMTKQTKGIGEALAEIVLFQSLVRLPHSTQLNPLLCKTTQPVFPAHRHRTANTILFRPNTYHLHSPVWKWKKRQLKTFDWIDMRTQCFKQIRDLPFLFYFTNHTISTSGQWSILST